MIVNAYMPNVETSSYIKQMLLDVKREISSIATVLRAFSAHFHQWTDHPAKIRIRQ
jgi:hypothetical protein